MMIYETLADNRLDFHLGSTEVTDHRMAADRKDAYFVKVSRTSMNSPRLDLGRLALRPSDKILPGNPVAPTKRAESEWALRSADVGRGGLCHRMDGEEGGCQPCLALSLHGQ